MFEHVRKCSNMSETVRPRPRCGVMSEARWLTRKGLRNTRDCAASGADAAPAVLPTPYTRKPLHPQALTSQALNPQATAFALDVGAAAAEWLRRSP